MNPCRLTLHPRFLTLVSRDAQSSLRMSLYEKIQQGQKFVSWRSDHWEIARCVHLKREAIGVEIMFASSLRISRVINWHKKCLLTISFSLIALLC